MKTSVLLSFILTWMAFSSVLSQDDAPAKWQYPIGVASHGDTIYVADRQLPGIWVVQDGHAKVFFQGSRGFGKVLNAIRCLAIDQTGQLLVGDSATREIYRFDATGVPQPLTGGKIGIPMGIAVTPEGTIYVSDLELKQIVKVAGGGGEPELLAEIAAPTGLTLDADGNLLVVCRSTDPIRRVTSSGKVSVLVAGRPFKMAQDIAVDSEGTIFVTDGYAKTIWNVAADEAPQEAISGSPLIHPVGIYSAAEQLLVADPRAKDVFRIVDGKLESILTP